MPGRARLDVPGIAWHIIQRGNNRSACFYSEADYDCYLTALGKPGEKHGCDIHAYVLMTNQVHLQITPRRKNSAALLMKNLGQRYVQYINRTYRRSGTLREGRCKSCLAQSETYVLICYRYIELNPVRANTVQHPRDYRWSSHLANAEGLKNPILTVCPLYLRPGPADPERQAVYRGLFQAHLDHNAVTEIVLPQMETTFLVTIDSGNKSVKCSRGG